MIETSALCLFLVGLMHSVLGHRNLISPLLARKDFPVVLGSQRNGRLTLLFGWHALTLFWWAQAYVLWRMAEDPNRAALATLVSWAIACAMIGTTALVVSKAKHLSWMFFLPVAVLLGLAAYGG